MMTHIFDPSFRLIRTSVNLGPCKLLKLPKNNGNGGNLVFVKDVYDLDNLFNNKTISFLFFGSA